MPDHPTRTVAPLEMPTLDRPADRMTSDADGATAGMPGEEGDRRPPVAPPGYELLDEIGSGGMGVVYRARELALNRHVAVKILQDRFPAEGVAATRFVGEAQITGQLQHPGIPPVHQVGTLPDGRPYLVMKLIKGRTLEDDLKDRAEPSDDRGRLLAVFEQVCQAVACAHDRKVIHRDLKPANVMVGAFGEVQVMDWGLAKLLTAAGAVTEVLPAEPRTMATEIRTLRDSEGSFTQAGSVLGTPAFMPPEQAGGEIDRIDERSDVFGLGAILCVILTGKPVYVGKDSETVRLMAIRGLLDECMARLEACGAEPALLLLCKRCLASVPSDRPRNAGEVAKAVAGLRAEAEDRAKQAELDRAAALVKAAEQWKRRKVQAALGLVFTALVVLGGAFAWWAQDQRLAKEADARDRRTAAERDVNQAVEDAVAKFGRANGAGRDLALWAEARAAALHAEARAAEADAPPEVRDRVRRLVGEIEQVEKNRRLVATLLDIQASMGDTLDLIGDQDFAGADARYARAFRDYGTDLFASPPETGADLLRNLGGDVRVELAAAIDDWGYIRSFLTKKFDDTARLYQVTRLLDPDPLRNRIRDAVAAKDHPALKAIAAEIDPAVQPVQTVNLVAVYLYFLPFVETTDATRFLLKAQPHHPGDFQINHNLAFFLNRERRHAEALPYCAAAIAVRPTSAVAWQDSANALFGLGRDPEAVAAYRRICRLAPKSAGAHLQLKTLLSRMGDPDGALAANDEAVRIIKEAIQLDPTNARPHAYLGNVLSKNGDREGAIAEYREAIRLDPKDAAALNSLRVALLDKAKALEDKGDRDGALAARKEAVQIYKDAIRLDPKNALLHGSLGFALFNAGDPEGALGAYRESVRLEPQKTIWHDWVVYLQLQKGDGAGALTAAREAVRLVPNHAQPQWQLGRALQATGDLDGAIAAFEESLRLNPTQAGVRNALNSARLRKLVRDEKEGRIAPPPREVKRP